MEVKNVYLADDDTDDIEFFQEALEDVCETAVLTSGKNGVELMKKLLFPVLPVPDIIFLDINMPMMNGLECLKEIKSHEHLKAIPVVMYSTSALSSTIEVAYKLGASLFVEKSPEYDGLKKMIKTILDINWTATVSPVDFTNFVHRAS